MEAAGEDTYNQAKQVANNNVYKPYGGQNVADMAPNQVAGSNLAATSQGNWQGSMNNARAATMAAGTTFGQTADAGGWNAGMASKYMNPYKTSVQQDTLGQMNENYTKTIGDIGDSAHKAKAFGGDRHGIAEGEANKNHGENVARYLNTSNESAYNDASQKYNQDRAAEFQAFGLNAGQHNTEAARALGIGSQFGNLAGAESQLATNDINNLMATGSMAQTTKQAQLDAEREEYMRTYQDPFNRTNFLTGVMAGTPYTQSQTSTGPAAQNNTWGQVAGAGLMAASMYAGS
jgi:hypothetical protein